MCAFEHQKKIMEGVRHLTAAFERKERAAKANAAWADLLSGNATAAAPAPGEEEEEGADAGASTAERRPRPGGRRGAPPPHRSPRKAERSPLRSGGRGGGAEHGASDGSSAVYNPSDSAASLRVDLRLPRIAARRHGASGAGMGGSTMGAAGLGASIPARPSVKTPSMPPGRLSPTARLHASPSIDELQGGVGLTPAAAAKQQRQQQQAAADASAADDGRPPSPPLMAEQTQWRELALAYGLHLVPDTRELLRDNLQSLVMSHAPRPPDMPMPLVRQARGVHLCNRTD